MKKTVRITQGNLQLEQKKGNEPNLIEENPYLKEERVKERGQEEGYG